MSSDEPQAKRVRLASDAAIADRPNVSASSSSPSLPFYPGLLDPDSVNKLKQAHESSTPYKHGVIDQLFQPDFLKRARQEIVEQLSFTEKETDICVFVLISRVSFLIEADLVFFFVCPDKINQTGDLTNLSGLPATELALLPTLLQLRDALYSIEFRQFLQKVTGCGPLSGVKTDMSCAEYSQGCYLLNHDDVIGTRRISFILYLPLDEPAWKPEWGGALELYPVLKADNENPDRPNVPHAKPTKSIPPSFNQFAFFEVQPGHSFHSVEEVVVEGDGKRGGKGARVSLSGWFHKPVQGEEGYEGDEGYAAKSSLQQLYATTLEPPSSYELPPTLPLPLVPSSEDVTILQNFINPTYFTQSIISQLRPRFIEESQLLLADFLIPSLATELESLIRAADLKMESNRRGQFVGGRMTDLIPSHDQGSNEAGWTVVGPPHIQRFCTLSSLRPDPEGKPDRLVELLNEINKVMRTEAFRNLLSSFTNLLCLGYTTHVRRFRPGLDYTLARGEPANNAEEEQEEQGDGENAVGEAKLDVGLGLTPKPKDDRDDALWESGQVGGWDLWLVSEDGGDEATYSGGKKQIGDANGASASEDMEGQDEDEDDGPLLAFRPDWNQLSLVLRDAGVMKFVKYLSARAPGSRWDVAGEWQIAMVEEEGEDQDENNVGS
ncbi:putative component of NuA3 histone acetyltransferase complex [Microbotryomycetes sp. JL201]|nr:putative component of NuA3 histone acetyltransferase complex [Microbotryomycetes sp. JL201]